MAFSKYENDDVAQSKSMDNLLRLVRRSADAFWQLMEKKGMVAEFTRQTPMGTIKRNAEIHVLNEHRIKTGKAAYKPPAFQMLSIEESEMEVTQHRPKLVSFRALAFHGENKGQVNGLDE